MHKMMMPFNLDRHYILLVSVRQFADGRRVALYRIDKLNKYVTIPYGNLAWSGQAPIQAEETEE